MRFAVYACIGLICAAAALPPARAGLPRLPTEREDGRDYVRLGDFIRYYGFDRKWKRNAKQITLRKKFVTLRMKIDSREASIHRDGEEVRIVMCFPPLEDDDTILIPEIDVIKTLDPLLRPWAVPESRIQSIILDPGHGGFDNGTLGITRGIMEKHFALDTSERVERILRAAGYRTLMTRREDEYVPLEDRAEQSNVSSGSLFVSIHYNSAKPDRGPKGVETYCLTPAGAPSSGNSDVRMADYQVNPGNAKDAQNMLLAFCVHQAIIKNIPEASDRGVKRARFVVIKENKKPSILVECGFLSNPEDERRIRSPAYRERLARAISAGIVRYISLVNPKKVSTVAPKLRDA